jgi:hypothetical protein
MTGGSDLPPATSALGSGDKCLALDVIESFAQVSESAG